MFYLRAASLQLLNDIVGGKADVCAPGRTVTRQCQAKCMFALVQLNVQYERVFDAGALHAMLSTNRSQCAHTLTTSLLAQWLDSCHDMDDEDACLVRTFVERRFPSALFDIRTPHEMCAERGVQIAASAIALRPQRLGLKSPQLAEICRLQSHNANLELDVLASVLAHFLFESEGDAAAAAVTTQRLTELMSEPSRVNALSQHLVRIVARMFVEAASRAAANINAASFDTRIKLLFELVPTYASSSSSSSSPTSSGYFEQLVASAQSSIKPSERLSLVFDTLFELNALVTRHFEESSSAAAAAWLDLSACAGCIELVDLFLNAYALPLLDTLSAAAEADCTFLVHYAAACLANWLLMIDVRAELATCRSPNARLVAVQRLQLVDKRVLDAMLRMFAGLVDHVTRSRRRSHRSHRNCNRHRRHGKEPKTSSSDEQLDDAEMTKSIGDLVWRLLDYVTSRVGHYQGSIPIQF